MSKKTVAAIFGAALLILGAMLLLPQASSGEPGRASPYLADAPWPVMRADLKNTGRFLVPDWRRAPGAPERPVFFHTGNGVFSTPVIDGKERVYVGSADHYFYAFDPASNQVLWKYDALELIDSAAALSSDGRVYVPAGGAIFALDLAGNKLWAFDVTTNRPEGLYTFGTNFWWEGNVVVGPDHNVYAGNDDFFFYSIRPEGTMNWAARTGFLIWSVPAFGDDGTMFFSGFDMRLYALDRNTGKIKWKKNLKNPLVASPALGPDGTIYQGSFDGNLYALDPGRGKVLWTMSTLSHIYASAAVDGKGRVYVTSTDGFLYAVDGMTGEARWTFYTGDAVRSSPALGPDPEGLSDYLIYFGGGQGGIYAIDPEGHRRWSLDTLALVPGMDYPNLNASPALGRSGLAIANANGDVFYVPYDYYLEAGAAGVSRDPSEGYREEGARWHYVSPGGLIDKESVDGEASLSIHAGQVIMLRPAVVENGRIARTLLDPASVKVEASPPFKHRVEVFGDNKTVAVVPDELLDPGRDYSLAVSARYVDKTGGGGTVRGTAKLQVESANEGSHLIKGSGSPLPLLPLLTESSSFVITHMAFPQPPIIPSLDQIGIAIMRIPFSIVEADRRRDTFVAWGVQKYGASAGGEEQGIPDSRVLFYALSGKVRDDYFMMESLSCFFEESSFPFPLDRFRFSGRMLADGSVARDASLWAELDPPSMLDTIRNLSVSSEQASSGKQSWVGGALSGGGDTGFWDAALVSGPTVAGYISHHIWRPWDLYNYQGRFVASGTFRMAALPAGDAAPLPGLAVKSLSYDPKKREVTGAVISDEKRPGRVALAILLVDMESGKPVAINYNTATRRYLLPDGTRRTILTIPKDLQLKKGGTRAYLMVDLFPARKMEF
ncbi:MAG TPA: PQQ-binding-like beta-propeller repeat protein [bacterium]|nr:PQQ-binding-like beta-propeller repeat protein [bacterium]